MLNKFLQKIRNWLNLKSLRLSKPRTIYTANIRKATVSPSVVLRPTAIIQLPVVRPSQVEKKSGPVGDIVISGGGAGTGLPPSPPSGDKKGGDDMGVLCLSRSREPSRHRDGEHECVDREKREKEEIEKKKELGRNLAEQDRQIQEHLVRAREEMLYLEMVRRQDLARGPRRTHDRGRER